MKAKIKNPFKTKFTLVHNMEDKYDPKTDRKYLEAVAFFKRTQPELWENEEKNVEEKKEEK